MFHNTIDTAPKEQGPCFTLPKMQSIALPSTVYRGPGCPMHVVCPILNVTDGTGGVVEGSMLLLCQSASLHDACDEDPQKRCPRAAIRRLPPSPIHHDTPHTYTVPVLGLATRKKAR